MDSILDNFNLFFADVDRILGALKPILCLLNLCPLWLVKARRDMGPSDSYYQSVPGDEICSEELKEVVVVLLLKKPSL